MCRICAFWRRKAVRPAVLLVEDHPRVRAFLEAILGALDVDLSYAADGSAGLDAARKRDFDLIVTDLHMAPADGFMLLEGLAALPAHRRTPKVIVCSSLVGSPALEARLDLTAIHALIGKPVNPRLLLSAVGTALFKRDLTIEWVLRRRFASDQRRRLAFWLNGSHPASCAGAPAAAARGPNPRLSCLPS